MRQLVMKLEFVESLILAHPFIKGFERTSYCLSDEEMRLVAQGDVSETIAKRTKEDIEGKEGASIVYSTTFYIGLQIEPKQGEWHLDCEQNPTSLTRLSQAGAVGPRRLDISYPTTEFTKLVKLWEQFDDSTMGIVVRHIKKCVSDVEMP